MCSFHGRVLFHCTHIPCLLDALICQWTSRFLPCPSCCKWCRSERRDACVCLDRGIRGYVPSSGTAGSRDRFILSLLKSLHTVLHGGSTESASLPMARWDSHFSTPRPALTVHSFSFIFLFGCSGSQLWQEGRLWPHVGTSLTVQELPSYGDGLSRRHSGRVAPRCVGGA